MRRVARLALLYTLEAVAASLALAIFVGGALLWRLAEGPVNADMLRPAATEALLGATGGDAASIGSLEVSFDPALAAIVVTAREVAVARAGGEVILDAGRIETALALDLLLTGRAAPVRIAAEGGAFSLIRLADGGLRAGLGAPETVRRSRAGGGIDGLGALTSGLESGGGVFARLSVIDLRGVDLQIVDEVSDWRGRLREARAALILTDAGVSADLSGGLITSAGLAPVALRIETGRDLETVFVDLRIRDLVPAAAAPLRGPLARLGGLDAPVAVDLVVDASTREGLRAALVEVQAAPGVVRAGGRSFALREGRLSLGLDAAQSVLEVNAARVDSDVLSVDLSGRVLEFAGFDDALPARARIELASGPGRIDLTPTFAEPLVWESAVLDGAVDLDTVTLRMDWLELVLPGAAGRMEGEFRYDRALGLPALKLAGVIEGEIGKADVLRYWPVDFALGARDWVNDSIIAGRLSEARLDLDIPPEAIAAEALADEHLSLAFRFRDADVRYMATMTPLLGLSGRAVLRGDSLELQGTGGAIGPLQIDTIFVDIARFTPKGGPARFGGTGRGRAADVIALIDEPPLEIAQTYGLDPASFDGEGGVAFEIVRPMLRTVPPEDMDYRVTGRFENVGAPTGVGDLRLTDGTVDIHVDTTGFLAEGEARIAGAPARLTWTETFGLEEGLPSSEVVLKTVMSARDLDRAGLPLRRFLDGAVGVDARILGQGMAFQSVDLTLDLGQAALALPGDLWAKDAGAPALARLSSRFAEDGVIVFDRLSLEGEGVALAASAELAPDGRLASATLDRLFVEGRMDLSGAAQRPDGLDGRLELSLRGAYLDIDAWISPAEGEGPLVSGPVSINAEIDRVGVRDVVFDAVRFTAELLPEGVAAASLDARAGAGPVALQFGPGAAGADGARQLDVQAEDAGVLLAAFAGYDNASGGAMTLSAVAPPVGQDGPITGELLATGFTLERMPLLARILAAGSLEGLAGLLSGQGGIDFERLQGAFVWQDGVLEMREARVAGPALGVTWTGVVDMPGRRTDVDGTILPSYGVNSVLGSVPVVGEIFTSRRGEGVFGVTFSAAGPFDGIRVVANPLSALAPGVFRRIFEGTSAERELDALEAERRARETEAPQLSPGPDGSPDPEASEPAAPELEAPAPDAPEAGGEGAP